MSTSSRREKILSVVRGSSGNGQAYDFSVFGYDASCIGKTFLPASSASLLRRLHGPPASRVARLESLASPFASTELGA